jgi:hypothetical protein
MSGASKAMSMISAVEVLWDDRLESQKLGLTQETWRFVLIDQHIVLDSYLYATRATKRHKFKATKAYLRQGRNQDYYCAQVQEADVPWLDNVREHAMAKIVAQLSVVRWRTDLKKT